MAQILMPASINWVIMIRLGWWSQSGLGHGLLTRAQALADVAGVS